VPDLFEVKGAAKVRCFGREAALDGLTQPAGTLIGRITPDEVIFVGQPGTAAQLVEDLQAQLAGEGNAALVIDHTDGWSFHSLVGEGIEEVFAREANWKLPETDGGTVFTVGRVCHVAGKLFVRPGRIDIMTGAEVHEHVHHALLHAGHHVNMHEVAAPADDPIGVGREGVAVS
jgi:hypothetical protein